MTSFRIIPTAALVAAVVLFAGCSERSDRVSDLSTPKTAVATLLGALNARDSAAVKDCFLADTPAQQQYVAAMAQLLDASRKLRQAATARFGSEEAKQLLGNGLDAAEYIGRFQQAKESIQGDAATLTTAGGQELRLHKQSGKWKVLPAEDDKALAGATQAMDALARAMTQAADQIGSGQIKDILAAKQVVAKEALN